MKDLHYLCEKETFLKLKEVNKFLTKAKHAYGTWYRAKRKEVYKIKIPSLKKYHVFIQEYGKGEKSGKIDWMPKGERSHKSRWLINDPYTRSYEYLQTHYGIDKWACLHTYYIDEEYSRARHPRSPEYIAENPLKISKEKIDELYAEIQKITGPIAQRT